MTWFPVCVGKRKGVRPGGADVEFEGWIRGDPSAERIEGRVGEEAGTHESGVIFPVSPAAFFFFFGGWVLFLI